MPSGLVCIVFFRLSAPSASTLLMKKCFAQLDAAMHEADHISLVEERKEARGSYILSADLGASRIVGISS